MFKFRRERRQEKRYEVNIKAECFSPKDKDTVFKGTVKNVSFGGIYFESVEKIPLHEPLNVNMFNDDGTVKKATTEGVWQKTETLKDGSKIFGTGMKFITNSSDFKSKNVFNLNSQGL